jgi:TusA-related sulfurtransferase
MPTNYQIDTNIPLPAIRGERGELKKTLENLAIGESILVTHYASGTINEIKKIYPERRYTRRRELVDVTTCIRVWRVS